MCFFTSFVVVVQSLSHVQLFVTPWNAARRLPCPSLSLGHELKLMSTKSMIIPSNHLILCCPLLLLSSIVPSNRSFHRAGSLYQVAKVLELQHQSFQWILRVDFFRMDWLDLLAIQGALMILLQHHSSKASILWRSAFFRVQLSHPYMTTGKTIALSIRTFVSKAMSLLFNTLSKFVIAFLPRRKCLLTSRLQSPPVVILESKKIKSVIVSTFLSCVHLSSIKETSQPLLLFYFLNLMQNLS